MSSSKLVLVATPAALVFSLVTGCGSSDGKSSDARPADFVQPEGLSAALETPILDCQSESVDCVANAADLDARIACNDTLAQCLQTAADKAQAIAGAAEACREDGRVCLQDDANDADTCRANYEACADAALNGNGGTDAGAPSTDPDVGSALDGGTANPGLPGLPNLPLPSLPGLPGLLGGVDAGAALEDLPAPVKCTVELRLCVATDPLNASQCADTARVCLTLP